MSLFPAGRRSILTVAAVCGLTVGIAALVPANAAPPAQSAKPTQGVNVTNGPGNPVPVTAAQSGPWTVGINGTPNVAIAGTPSVAIAGTPSVTVAGTPNVNVTNFPAAAPTPLWQGTPYVRTMADFGGERCQPLDIPQGTVLFAERVTVNGVKYRETGELTFLELTPLGENFAASPVYVPTAMGPTTLGGDTYSGTLDLEIPVTTMSVCLGERHTATVFGYLLPTPAAP